MYLEKIIIDVIVFLDIMKKYYTEEVNPMD